MYNEALEEAKKADKKLKECLKKGLDPYKTLGKLHGIPFSTKDHIQIKNTVSTNGFGTYTDFELVDGKYKYKYLHKED